MSDLLDDDAFLLILDELATPVSDYDVYCAAKEALRNVCLASHRLRRLAQPLLWRRIWVVKQSQAKKVKSSPVVSSLGQSTRWYIIGKREYGAGKLPHAVAMARVLPSVEKLLLSGPWRPHNLARIESFSKLRHLSLVQAQLDGYDMICTAPLVEELDIHQSCISFSGAVEWLQPVRLPALRILSVCGFRERTGGIHLQLNDVLGPAILAQLDVLQTDQENLEPESALALGTAPLVLFFESLFDHSTFPRYSLHLLTKATTAIAVMAELVYLAGRLQQALSGSARLEPRVVVLPRRVLSLAAQHQMVTNSMRRLERVCGRAVRIIWTGGGGTDLLSGGVSREFVQYARELKAAQAASEGKA